MRAALLLTLLIALPSSCSAQTAVDNSQKVATTTLGDQKIQGPAPALLRFEHGVRTILEDSKGNFWFGTWQEGVARFDGKEFTYFTEADGLDRNQVRNVFEDQGGTIWFNTGDGICSYDHSASLRPGGKSFTIMNNSSGGFDGSVTTDLHVRAIYEDSKGRLWIGNNGIGVLLQEDGKTINFTQKHGLGSQENRRGGPLPGDAKDGSPSLDRVFSIGEDAAGNIWFGVNGKQGTGAWRFDGKTLRHFTEKDGLTSKGITAIYLDKRGDLWLGGDGVFKFNGKSFDRIH